MSTTTTTQKVVKLEKKAEQEITELAREDADTTDSNLRYMAYANRLRTAMRAASRYTAYTSDIGEAFRPVVAPWIVKSAYGVSWLYLLGDVSYETYKARVRGPSALDSATGLSENSRLGMVFVKRSIFQAVASMALPAFTIHTAVKQATKAFRNASSPRVKAWGPTVTGLANPISMLLPTALPTILVPSGSIQQSVLYEFEPWPLVDPLCTEERSADPAIMTSFILRSVQDRPPSYPPKDNTCTFCRIISRPSEAYVVYEDENCMAFLDIYPMRPGHTLLIPKQHYARLADLPAELGESMGRALPRITKAINEATGNPDLNVVCNQGYAQAVHHVHWHLVPAPIFDAPNRPTMSVASKLSKSSPNKTIKNGDKKDTEAFTHQHMLRGEMAYRDFLDDDDAKVLAEKIRSKL
ncbi:hypothetical protein QFC19_001150 [Naganishia cerealis]|uniref:Uncharacterized protein n=1 Tax=Naganishia cerealis TaxID=610337 RepID=A0ACC2WIB1_9TREE|nr:hypothetical protein QFC19_001150 [Naganishia cerealis]